LKQCSSELIGAKDHKFMKLGYYLWKIISIDTNFLRRLVSQHLQ